MILMIVKIIVTNNVHETLCNIRYYYNHKLLSLIDL